ncbi:DUF357 domain-containing protein [Methanocalculus sp. MSAO_Arc2]|uniref:DUF357 domain-containing protein n=1 Tax=Methanocalculus sp. MSAO_Arc2 TaxID=2293855 RepID=UPI00268803EC
MNEALITLCRSFRSALGSCTPAITTISPYRKIAEEIVEMATAYKEDGWVFYTRNDPVNALAAWYYGYGWLDAGTYLGVINTDTQFPGIDGCIDIIPPLFSAILEEKTIRYANMLTLASLAIDWAPDSSSPIYLACAHVVSIVEQWRTTGDMYLQKNWYAPALASYSYGYGWLDCGVRAGLFRITGDRRLFTA